MSGSVFRFLDEDTDDEDQQNTGLNPAPENRPVQVNEVETIDLTQDDEPVPAANPPVSAGPSNPGPSNPGPSNPAPVNPAPGTAAAPVGPNYRVCTVRSCNRPAERSQDRCSRCRPYQTQWRRRQQTRMQLYNRHVRSPNCQNNCPTGVNSAAFCGACKEVYDNYVAANPHVATKYPAPLPLPPPPPPVAPPVLCHRCNTNPAEKRDGTCADCHINLTNGLSYAILDAAKAVIDNRPACGRTSGEHGDDCGINNTGHQMWWCRACVTYFKSLPGNECRNCKILRAMAPLRSCFSCWSRSNDSYQGWLARHQ
ncbi:hypothetical protein QBC35DRAFT_452472 [Podospora australis]|uniref:Uncharacterized protein n=1 Tax=Podospora australis TaxID=1536484 RepID=A0AAN6WSN9_9PEZI|nr:hypothetical protein QBC35DRAFT_452472 [Podospora australis]